MNHPRKFPIQSLALLPWQPAPRDLTLPADELHLWRIALTGASDHWQSTLSKDEQTRAERLRFARDRDQFVITRGTLRTLLAQYLNVAPTSLQFGFEATGKPYLMTTSGARAPLGFNVSHTHGLALLALAWHRELGVDVEQVRAELAEEMTAQQFLSPSELQAFRRLPRALQTTAFFNSWTCKEAVLKATGAGFSIAPQTIAVTLDEDAEPRGMEVPAGDAWSLWQVVPQPGYAGALALQGAQAAVRCYT